MQERLANALFYAALGWKIFPCRWDEKTKRHRPVVQWTTDSTDNPQVIKAWHEKYRRIYFCVNLKASGICVIDQDVKNGKPGIASLFDLELKHGRLPDTLKVKTPSTGFHYIYKGILAQTKDRLGKGIDTPSMIPLPDQEIAMKGAYTVVENRPVAEIPEWVEKLVAYEARPTGADTAVVEPDLPENILAATRHAADAKPAVAGQGGNARTYQVACELFEMGVSLDVCREIMLDFYNPRCDPPWDAAELNDIVEHAHRYKRNPTGIKAVAAEFPAIEFIPTHNVADLDLTKIEHHNWIINGRYARGFATGTVAPGGLGKSAYVQNEAVAVASGEGITGLTVNEPCNVWLYNLEDPRVEMERRFGACAVLHAINYKQMPFKLLYSTGREKPLLLAKEGRAGGPDGRVVVNYDAIDGLVDHVQKNDIGLVLIDPLINCHRIPENENNAVFELMEIFNKIAIACNCGLGITHHTRKDSMTARGASAFLNSLMLCHILRYLAEKEAVANDITRTDLEKYICLETYKTNLGYPLLPSTYWMHKERVKLPNDDPQEALGLKIVSLGRINAETVQSDILDAMAVIMGLNRKIRAHHMCRELLAGWSGLFDFRSMRSMREWLETFLKEPRRCPKKGPYEYLTYACKQRNDGKQDRWVELHAYEDNGLDKSKQNNGKS